ncbi:MAG: NYN domain-containing protein [Eubacteriales bacterium]|nr:NYN domain-containing protein [Eubacteriales bacterium]MDD4421680.1 NYN domain-containing protein [Eubacteriales bacterium]
MQKAVAFVDYEHWYISLKNNFGLQPNIKGWFEDLNRQFNLVEVSFFADFSHKSLSDEIRRIRLFSNKIIDTRNPYGVKKDFTDFIILDNIYQKALSSDDIKVFILFSGDGHFSSVTSFLKNFYHKEVVIYGIKDSFSKNLQETASRTVTLPTEQDIHGNFYQLIFDYLKESSRPTFNDAVASVVKKSKGATKQQISASIKKLMENDYISERTLNNRGRNGIMKKQLNLFVDWDKVQKSGINQPY